MEQPRRLQVDLLARLTAYQKKKRYSFRVLAKKLGISNQTIVQWLDKHRKLRADECQRVEDFLKLNE